MASQQPTLGRTPQELAPCSHPPSQRPGRATGTRLGGRHAVPLHLRRIVRPVEELEVCLGIAWQTPHAVDESALGVLIERFDVDGGDPCVTCEPAGPGLIVTVTWDAHVATDDPTCEGALREARRLAEQRFASAGLEGRLLSADVMTDDSQATWLADR